MTNGQAVLVRLSVKPIPTVPHPLRTVDIRTGQPALADHQRSDIAAVVPAAIVAEAMCALVVANAVLEKFGGDSLAEVQRNYRSYLSSLPGFLL
jgi:chorismate synthase